MNDEPIKKLVSHSVEARKINEIIDFINIEFKRRDDALSKIAERYKSIPDSYVAKLARAARGGDGAIYLHTSLEGLEEISKITMLEAALSELLMPRLNEMIERINLLTNILIRLKNKEVKMNDLHPENNKIFAELAGIPWDTHEGRYGNFNKNPNYAADPRLVLREMERIGKLMGFLIELNLGACGFIYSYILDETGKARDAAIEFMKEAKCSDQ